MSFRRFSFALASGLLAAGLLAPAAAPSPPEETQVTAAPVAAVERTATTRWGPYTIPAATQEEHGELANQIELNVEKPCNNCYITGFKPNLVYADGSNANINTGPMLHHIVVFDSGDDDVVCRGPRRVLATGNERTNSTFPPGYGFKVDWGERWTLLYDLMNRGHEEKEVYIEIEFTYERAWFSDIEEVTPIWMDAGGCAGSAWDVPPGEPSRRSNTWTSTISGDLVHMRGHLHHAGIDVQTENTSTGDMLCRSVAEEGGHPEFTDHHGRTEIHNMPTCSGTPVGRINRGDTLEISARYKAMEHPHHGVMGIMTGWVDED